PGIPISIETRFVPSAVPRYKILGASTTVGPVKRELPDQDHPSALIGSGLNGRNIYIRVTGSDDGDGSRCGGPGEDRGSNDRGENLLHPFPFPECIVCLAKNRALLGGRGEACRSTKWVSYVYRLLNRIYSRSMACRYEAAVLKSPREGCRE